MIAHHFFPSSCSASLTLSIALFQASLALSLSRYVTQAGNFSLVSGFPTSSSMHVSRLKASRKSAAAKSLPQIYSPPELLSCCSMNDRLSVNSGSRSILWTWPPRKLVIGRTKKGTLLLRTKIVDEQRKMVNGESLTEEEQRYLNVRHQGSFRLNQPVPVSTPCLCLSPWNFLLVCELLR